MDMTVHQLRRLWKPTKERLLAEHGGHPTHVRFHRACSWLQRAEQIEDREADLDITLTCMWIAFNALYGQWDERAGEPLPGRENWKRFLDRILKLDAEGRLEAMLTEHKKLVMAILDDSYLEKYFWRDPSTQKALKTTREKHSAATWYLAGQWGLVLEHLVDHIYILRCQLLHGAATFNSRRNRSSLKRCVAMLDHLLPTILLVWIEHGADEDWGPMCYPPVG